MVPYRTPRSHTAGSRVNSPRKAGSTAMQPAIGAGPSRHRQRQPVGGGGAGPGPSPPPPGEGDQGVHPDAETDGRRVDEILDRVDQRQGSAWRPH